MMQWKTIVLTMCTVASSVMGQLLLKTGAQHLSGLGRLDFVIAAARDVRVLSGLAATVLMLMGVAIRLSGD